MNLRHFAGRPVGTIAERVELGFHYREQKAQLDLQAQQLERMRNAGVKDTKDILLRISTIGSIISRGTPAQQKDALRALFDRIDIDNEGWIVGLEPRAWARPLFCGLAKEDPAVAAGSIPGTRS